jgi:hypothetical protein
MTAMVKLLRKLAQKMPDTADWSPTVYGMEEYSVSCRIGLLDLED